MRDKTAGVEARPLICPVSKALATRVGKAEVAVALMRATGASSKACREAKARSLTADGSECAFLLRW